MTKADFEQAYAARSGVTLEWLREKRQVAVPCLDCGYDACNGWQMVTCECGGSGCYAPVCDDGQTLDVALRCPCGAQPTWAAP